MKKKILQKFSTVAIAAFMAGGFGISNAAEIAVGEKVTLNPGETLAYVPESDGILTVEFTGEFPDAGLMFSDRYDINTNPSMEMLYYNAIGYAWQSPLQYEIVKTQLYPVEQADGSVEMKSQTVQYEFRGGADPMELTLTFEAANEDNPIELLSVSPEPDEVFNFNKYGNIVFTFDTQITTIKPTSIAFDIYNENGIAIQLTGEELEAVWRNEAIGYYINITNLWTYYLENHPEFVKFVVTISGFNREIIGDLVDEEGNVVLEYGVDAYAGMVTLVSNTEWPAYFYPQGANPESMTFTYSAPLSKNVGTAEALVIGAALSEINAEPPKTAPIYTLTPVIEGNTLTLNFKDFKQTGPIDDNGNLTVRDGYFAAGGNVTVVVKNFMGADGSPAVSVFKVIPFDPSGEAPDPDDPNNPDDPDDSGVVAIDGAASHWTVYNTQGILLLDTDNEALVEALPAGLYIINGKLIRK